MEELSVHKVNFCEYIASVYNSRGKEIQFILT